jgi:hypothetical protein
MTDAPEKCVSVAGKLNQRLSWTGAEALTPQTQIIKCPRIGGQMGVLGAAWTTGEMRQVRQVRQCVRPLPHFTPSPTGWSVSVPTTATPSVSGRTGARSRTRYGSSPMR